jgi:hypothetical protein
MASTLKALVHVEHGAAGLAFMTMLDCYAHLGHVLHVGAHLLQSVWYGQMDSGSLDTTANNNRMRTAGAFVAGAATTITAGDDLLADRELTQERMRRTGALPKRVKNAEGEMVDSVVSNWKRGEKINFTSHNFYKEGGEWKATFCNADKSIGHLLLTQKGGAGLAERLAGLGFAMRHTPEALASLQSVCKAKGWTMPAKEEWRACEPL